MTSEATDRPLRNKARRAAVAVLLLAAGVGPAFWPGGFPGVCLTAVVLEVGLLGLAAHAAGRLCWSNVRGTAILLATVLLSPLFVLGVLVSYGAYFIAWAVRG